MWGRHVSHAWGRHISHARGQHVSHAWGWHVSQARGRHVSHARGRLVWVCMGVGGRGRGELRVGEVMSQAGEEEGDEPCR